MQYDDIKRIALRNALKITLKVFYKMVGICILYILLYLSISIGVLWFMISYRDNTLYFVLLWLLFVLSSYMALRHYNRLSKIRWFIKDLVKIHGYDEIKSIIREISEDLKNNNNKNGN